MVLGLSVPLAEDFPVRHPESATFTHLAAVRVEPKAETRRLGMALTVALAVVVLVPVLVPQERVEQAAAKAITEVPVSRDRQGPMRPVAVVVARPQ